MEVILRATKRRVKKPVIKDHYWYDTDTGQRLHGRGGKMIFVYDRKNKKQVPRIVDDEAWVNESNFDEILDFAKTNPLVETIHAIAPGLHVTIETSARSFSSLEDELRFHRIQYDYDHNEFSREIDGKEKKWQNSASKWRILRSH